MALIVSSPRPSLDVVVPARNEVGLISSCLVALLADSSHLDLLVTVVVNGSSDGTADRARSIAPAYADAGQVLQVIETSAAGKASALNVGDAHRRRCSVIYLDADTVITPGTLEAVVGALATNRARLVGPRVRVVRPTSAIAAGYAYVWQRLPTVEGDVAGGGCYAVNPEGRARWGKFPVINADDAFVRSRFTRHERVIVDGGAFFLVFPGGVELRRLVRRWRVSNRVLRDAIYRTSDDLTADPSGLLRANLAALVRRHPSALTRLPAFLAVTVAARVPDRGSPVAPGTSVWTSPARPTAPRWIVPLSSRPRIHVIVVTFNSREYVGACLDSVRSDWADLTVSVLDNASTDGTADFVAERYPDVDLVRESRNLGFGRAVNTVVAGLRSDVDFVLLLNPDARLSSATIDELLAAALRFPTSGLVGGRMSDRAGRLDRSCCLALPRLSHAVRFAMGLSAIRQLRLLDAESLGAWNREDYCEVPVLTAGVLLVHFGLWQALGGFDERFFMYGEDVDLCLRARELQARPFFTSSAPYVHEGGASSSPAGRQVLILRGKATLYDRELGKRIGAIAGKALVAGVALRAAAEGIRGRPGKWDTAWRRRREWRAGWPDRELWV